MSPDRGASNFDRLHPSVRYLVQEVLRFPGLRPVQDATIGPVLAGRDCVVIAPTAGGKTEAAAFPVLSRILSERMEPVAALYICPLRALMNNQESRLTRMAETSPRRSSVRVLLLPSSRPHCRGYGVRCCPAPCCQRGA